jgi:hypothetical protein
VTDAISGAGHAHCFGAHAVLVVHSTKAGLVVQVVHAVLVVHSAKAGLVVHVVHAVVVVHSNN